MSGRQTARGRVSELTRRPERVELNYLLKFGAVPLYYCNIRVYPLHTDDDDDNNQWVAAEQREKSVSLVARHFYVKFRNVRNNR